MAPADFRMQAGKPLGLIETDDRIQWPAMPGRAQTSSALMPANLFGLGQMRYAATFAQACGQKRNDLTILHVTGRKQERDNSSRPRNYSQSIAPDRARIPGQFQIRKILRHQSCEVRSFAETSRHIAVCFRYPPSIRGEVKIK